jgi:Mannosylglycerate hydrolase MGH1-like glycoside hydrolase domain
MSPPAASGREGPRPDSGALAAAALALAERVLRWDWTEGERDGFRYRYTRPSPGRYPWQWYWDSCFAAIVWRRFDRGRARAELETLLAAQRPDGFLGHTVFWDRPVSLGRLPFYNVASRGAFQTETIQPPLLAWAWRIAVGDPAAEPRIAAQAEWLTANRDLEGDGLLWLVQPDESGLDASPKFDPVWGRRANGRAGFPLLVRRNRRLGFDARRVRADGGPVLCEVLTNTLWSLSLQALGRPSATPALVERLWDERRGLFVDEAQPGGLRPVPVTWAALAPLALPDLPEAIGRHLVEEHLLDPDEFLTPVAPPSVAVGDPGYEPGGGRGPIRRYWRGPTWVNSAWLVWLGLRRLGYEEEARTLAAGVLAAAVREGLREYYDPRTGRGLGAKDFAWSALVAELADPDPAIASNSSLARTQGGRRGERTPVRDPKATD